MKKLLLSLIALAGLATFVNPGTALAQSGNVGIGTSNPAAKLDVNNGDIKINQTYVLRWGPDTLGERIYSQQSLGVPGNNLYLELRENILFIADRNNTLNESNESGFIWASNRSWRDGTAPTEHMRLTDAGRLAIGVGVPTDKVHVSVSTDNDGIVLSQTQHNNAVMLNSNTGGGYLGFVNDTSSTNATLTAWIQQHAPGAVNGNNLEYFTAVGNHVFKGGRVGVGTDSPAAGFQLDVEGNIQSGNIQLVTLAGAGNREIGVNAAGSVIIFASDGRLKKDIANLNTGLDKVMKLRPVYYNWKDAATFGKQRELGFIAQEVKEIVPEVTGTFKKDGQEYNTVSYDKLVPVLAKAIQEQQRQIEALQLQNTELKAQGGEFTAQLASLKSIVEQLHGALKAGNSSVSK